MSLPNGFLDELRSRICLSDVVGRKVQWDLRKSNQARGDMWAPCPFHQEKTASFHVDDNKGFYYCFGCQAKGDAIGFIKETENVNFIEAVEILASEVGLQMPEFDPKSKEKADRNKILLEIMEQSVNFFRLTLNSNQGKHALEYLKKRGICSDAIERFEIGFAPADQTILTQKLIDKGYDLEAIIETGMSVKSDESNRLYDRFRGRVMFPIRDSRGRCIAFGGRSLDPAARAKYLNSPETPLFDKGSNLYNLVSARSAVGRGEPLIVTEGYMDVIALDSGNFNGAIAPLGTAITEKQLQLMWRISPEPIIALDGDKAGLRAAYRLIDLSLPLLRTGKALRFSIMPEGKDPDDLIRNDGASVFKNLIDEAVPMVDLIWRRETESKSFDSPERRAGLDKSLADAIALIKEKNLKNHYRDALFQARRQFFGRQNTGKTEFKSNSRLMPQSYTKSSFLVAADEKTVSAQIRESTIIAVLMNFPELIEIFYDELVMIDLASPDCDLILKELVKIDKGTKTEIKNKLMEKIGGEKVEKLLSLSHLRVLPCLRVKGTIEMGQQTLREELAKLNSERGLSVEVDEINNTPPEEWHERDFSRLEMANNAKQRTVSSVQEDTINYEQAQNGLNINREERLKLDEIRKTISFGKKKS
ncbi:MAG: DNA primase [Paracoccaceae bacterium]|uniref:DNA primase n=1 Tax=Candidatus Salinivivens marinus TaxID=3381703 RepID=UPI0038853504